jgi:hypothetical protein
LAEVWGNILEKAIESQINPAKQVTSETVKLPARVADARREQTVAAGMTLNQYLE